MADAGTHRGDVEAEGGVGGEALGVHSVQDGDAGIDVVVDIDVMLALVGAQESSDVLHDPTLEGEREREEQRVECGPVESFAEVGAGGDEDDANVGKPSSDGVADRGSCLLAEAARNTSAWSPSSASWATIASMWSLRWVRTRQVRPLETARGRRRRSVLFAGRRRRVR